MAKNKFNKNWLHDHVNDPFVRLAQKDGYRARAAYKLKEIDEDEKLLKPGQVVVDLGCAPGSWAQYVRTRLMVNGKVEGTIVGLDMLAIEAVPDVHFIQGDFREESALRQLESVLTGRQVDLVLSDMAPNISGIAVADAARMEDIVELAVDFARAHLKPSGALLAKCFNGTGYAGAVERFRSAFTSVTVKKPKASRDRSSEVFLLGRTLRKST